MEYITGNEIVNLLMANGMSQDQIASELGCSQSEVSRWKNGKNVPNGTYMIKLYSLYQTRLQKPNKE